jgi:putative peptidoglycan lipid II flippase
MARFNGGNLVSAAFILSVASLASRLVGLVRERVLTTTFGAGDVFDAFVAAFRLPDLIFNLLVVGALSAAFIPLFTDKLINHKDKSHAAFDFASALLNWLLVGITVLSLAYALLAHLIVPLITPGFSGEKLELTIRLTRIMAWQPILLSISFVLSGVLNSFKRFVVYSIAPILYNVGIIIGVLVFVPFLGPIGLAWGVVLGALFHVLVQLPSAMAVGWRWRPTFSWRTNELKKLWKMMLPRIFGLAAQQINLLTVTVLGSKLVTGSIAVFHLANNIQFLPIGIFGLSLAQAAFPTMAEQVSRHEEQAFINTLTRTFRYILFFVIPTTVLFYLLRAQIVRVLFGAGAFDWEDTILTFNTFAWLTVSIFAQATTPLLTRAFYVRQDTKTPVIISIISIIANVGLAIFLAPRFGVEGLAIAFSASAILNLVLLLGRLHWQLHGFNDREVILSLGKITLAAIVAGVVTQALKYPVAWVVDMTRFWGVFTQLTVASSGGILAYVGICWLLKSQELKAVQRYLPHRWYAFWTKAVPAPQLTESPE